MTSGLVGHEILDRALDLEPEMHVREFAEGFELARSEARAGLVPPEQGARVAMIEPREVLDRVLALERVALGGRHLADHVPAPEEAPPPLEARSDAVFVGVARNERRKVHAQLAADDVNFHLREPEIEAAKMARVGSQTSDRKLLEFGELDRAAQENDAALKSSSAIRGETTSTETLLSIAQ